MMTTAYNLADLMLYYTQGHAYEQHLKETKCQRFYIGSYFCGKYCMRSMHFFIENFLPYFIENKLKLSLVIPVLTEQESTSIKYSIQYFLEYCSICTDELIVNDYGMLEFAEHLSRQYPIRITAGRIFSKNFRDPRYSAYKRETIRTFFPKLLQDKVSAIEIDIISQNMDFSDIGSREIHVHYPYTYVTCGQNCEFAASRQPEGYRFIGRPGCGLSCMKGYMETSANDTSFLLLGKGVYTKSHEPTKYTRNPDRFIYWPADEFLKTGNDHENTYTI